MGANRVIGYRAMGLGMTKLGVLSLLASAGLASAQPVFTVIDWLPDGMASSANAISADGSTVVGTCTLMTGQDRAFRWRSDTGVQDLGLLPEGLRAQAFGVNADGSVVVGNCVIPVSINGPSDRPFRWTAGGMVNLGPLSGVDDAMALAISADGSTTVGYAATPFVERYATRWSPATSYLPIPAWTFSTAHGVSADGSVSAGSGRYFNGSELLNRAFRSVLNGATESLGVLPGMNDSSALGISGDGLTVVGFCDTAQPRAFRWTSAGGMVDLGSVTGSPYSTAQAANADGSVIVGNVDGGVISKAMAWTPSLGMVDLNEYLPSIGVDLLGWKLMSATGVSADGSAITGWALMGKDTWQAWVITGLTWNDACLADCDGNGDLNIDDFVCFQTLFALGDPGADCDGDASLTIDDFVCFQTIFAIGC